MARNLIKFKQIDGLQETLDSIVAGQFTGIGGDFTIGGNLTVGENIVSSGEILAESGTFDNIYDKDEIDALLEGVDVNLTGVTGNFLVEGDFYAQQDILAIGKVQGESGVFNNVYNKEEVGEIISALSGEMDGLVNTTSSINVSELSNFTLIPDDIAKINAVTINFESGVTGYNTIINLDNSFGAPYSGTLFYIRGEYKRGHQGSVSIKDGGTLTVFENRDNLLGFRYSLLYYHQGASWKEQSAVIKNMGSLASEGDMLTVRHPQPLITDIAPFEKNQVRDALDLYTQTEVNNLISPFAPTVFTSALTDCTETGVNLIFGATQNFSPESFTFIPVAEDGSGSFIVEIGTASDTNVFIDSWTTKGTEKTLWELPYEATTSTGNIVAAITSGSSATESSGYFVCRGYYLPA